MLVWWGRWPIYSISIRTSRIRTYVWTHIYCICTYVCILLMVTAPVLQNPIMTVQKTNSYGWVLRCKLWIHKAEVLISREKKTTTPILFGACSCEDTGLMLGLMIGVIAKVWKISFHKSFRPKERTWPQLILTGRPQSPPPQVTVLTIETCNLKWQFAWNQESERTVRGGGPVLLPGRSAEVRVSSVHHHSTVQPGGYSV